jgi:outer membrane murein-binding lipoprotein Lpp
MSLRRTFAAITATLLLAGCAKDNSVPEAGTVTRTPLFLLDRIEYKSVNATSTYIYNTDSTIKQVVHASTGTGAEVNYTYSSKAITRTELQGSLYITNYSYTNGFLTTVVSSQQGKGIIGYKLIYTYAPNGLLEEMKHYKIDEAGDHLQYTHQYQYNIDGLPAKITSTSANVRFITSIHNYSEECDFAPATFVNSSSLDELYAVYNYPLLSRLTRLPKNITVTRIEGQQAPVTDKIYDADFTITNKKLLKIQSSLTFPAYPQYNNSDELLFYYK